jgi:hypothetical protein
MQELNSPLIRCPCRAKFKGVLYPPRCGGLLRIALAERRNEYRPLFYKRWLDSLFWELILFGETKYSMYL